jgi:DNA-binding transcriptional LysR family regulator
MRVGDIRRVVCASPRYFARHGTPRRPADLAAHHCITFEGLTAPDVWTFAAGKAAKSKGAKRAKGATVSVAVRSRLVVNTAEAAIDAALSDVGIARVLSYQAADAVRDGTLVLALRAFEPAPIPVSLVHPSQPLLAQKVRAFLDFAAPWLKARLAKLGS